MPEDATPDVDEETLPNIPLTEDERALLDFVRGADLTLEDLVSLYKDVGAMAAISHRQALRIAEYEEARDRLASGAKAIVREIGKLEALVDTVVDAVVIEHPAASEAEEAETEEGKEAPHP